MSIHRIDDRTLIKSGQAEITMFEGIEESLLEKVVYVINHVYIGSYKANLIIKTTDVSVIGKKDVKPGFDITETSVETSFKKIKCNFINIDRKTIVSKTLYPNCKSEVLEEEDDIIIFVNSVQS